MVNLFWGLNGIPKRKLDYFFKKWIQHLKNLFQYVTAPFILLELTKKVSLGFPTCSETLLVMKLDSRVILCS